MRKLRAFRQFCLMTLRAYPVYFFSVISLSVLLSILISNAHHQREVKHLRQVNELHSMQMEAIVFSLKNTAEMVFQMVINQENTLKIMALAYESHEGPERDRLRALLLERLSPQYGKLKNKGIQQLHFHFPDSVSFLRFHKPESYGDNLQNVRPSLIQVNKTKEPVHGFEAGRNYLALRNVFPLFHNQQFVGTVELSYAFMAERELAYRLFPAIYTLILDKKHMDEALEPSHKEEYALTLVSSSHLRANLMVPHIKQELEELDLLSFGDFKILITQLHDLVKGPLQENQSFSTAHQLSGIDKVFVASFLPISDIKGAPLAYYVIYHEDLALKDFNRRYLMVRRVVLGLTLFLLLSGFAYARQVIGKEKYQALATTDSLTGLANRLHFNMIMEQSLREVRRSERPLSLVMLDIDNFKQVNDIYGHYSGDRVLIALTAKLQWIIRDQDFLARWGGEEFIILLPDTDVEQACLAVEKFRLGVAEMVVPAGVNQIKVTASFGVAEYTIGMKSDELFKLADEALYQAKSRGKNCVVRS